jgi:uncharacterized membrane protein YfcA
MDISIDILALLFFVGTLAGVVDAIAGGGGLITIPALLSAGLPPATALATNKLQASFGSFTSSLYFVRKKMVHIRDIKFMIFMSFVGAILGGIALLEIDPSILKTLIPYLLIAIGIYFLLFRGVGEVEKHKIISTTIFSFTMVVLVAFYDGFFGPGTGSFFAIGFIFFLGYNIQKATAHTKVLNFITNFASVIFFMIFGEIYFEVGIVMGVGQVIGSLVGARLVVTKGKKIIRPIIVLVSFAMAIKLLT